MARCFDGPERERRPTITGDAPASPDRDYPQEVRVLEVDGREFVLVGTAHVSRESADLVRRVIEQENPDRVCVELDEQRFKALTQKTNWDALDLKQLIRTKQLTTLMVNLLLASYQKRLGLRLGVMPGTELLEAIQVAEERQVPVALCDRNIRLTILRAWRSMSWWKKNTLLAALLTGVFGKEELSEKDLRELRQRDVLSELIQDLAREMPTLKRVLIDERDTYLAQKIRESEGRRIVAIVGAGHLDGIEKALLEGRNEDLGRLEQIPEAVPVMKIVGWAIPFVIVGGLVALAATKGPQVAGENLRFWILINGVPAGIGAILAAAHPLTILAAFVAAPITSLSPVIGAGYVTAFVQAYLRPPRVRDFQAVSEEVFVFGAWWRNRLLKVFLAFLLPTLGSIVGTYVGGAQILRNLF
jgi:pheromone shutdown-related protein TraB